MKQLVYVVDKKDNSYVDVYGSEQEALKDYGNADGYELETVSFTDEEWKEIRG